MGWKSICAVVDHRESRGTLRNLTAVCNVILAGEVPPAVHPFLCGVAASVADDNSAAGGISTDAPTPAPQPSSPVAVDPPPDQGGKLDGPARVVAADAKLDAVLAASGGARQAAAKDGACQFTAVGVRLDGGDAAQGGGRHARAR